MSFKKVRFGEGEMYQGEVIDCYGKTLEKWKIMLSDFPKLVKLLNDKYGLGMIIRIKGDTSDLDWAKGY